MEAGRIQTVEAAVAAMNRAAGAEAKRLGIDTEEAGDEQHKPER